MKILILFDAEIGWGKGYVNAMPLFYQHVASTLDNVRFVTFGPTYDFPVGTHVNQVISTLLGEDETPIIIHLTIWGRLLVSGLNEYRGIRVLDTEDQMNIEYTYIYMNTFNVVFYRCETKMIDMVKNVCKDHRFFHTPFFKNIDHFKDHKLSKEFDIFFSSSFSMEHMGAYHFRKRLYDIFTKQDKHKIALSVNSQVGQQEDFSKMINKSWLTVSTPTFGDKNVPNERNTNYYVGKFMEIPMSKGVVLGYLPHLAKDEYKDNYVHVTEEMTDEEIISVVDNALKDKEKLLKYSENIYDYFRSEYSYENGIKMLENIFLDLVTTVKPYSSKSDYDEHQDEYTKNINRVIKSGEFINGPDVKVIEQKLCDYIGVKHCISTGNGTDSLLIALLALDIKAGDEIITTPFTWISTSQVIILLGAIPVFVDIDPDTFNISPDLIEKAITSKTKAILPVSLFGRSCDLYPIMDIAEKNNLFVIEDAAQSMGATYKGKKSCSIAHISCTSFFPTKPLGCWGDGGACFTNDENLAMKMKKIHNHGCIERYEHDLIGVNSRLDSIQAAVLNVKMCYLDKSLEYRVGVAKTYDEELKEMKDIVLPKNELDRHVYAQYCILLKDKKTRDAFVHFMKINGIILPIFYPKLLYEFKTMQQFRTSCPNAEDICNRIVSLTCYDTFSVLEQNKVIKYTKLFFVQKN